MNWERRNRILREHFARVVRDLGQELLPEESRIAAAFLNAEKHVTEQDLLVLTGDPALDLGHVRRALRLLCELGVAQRTYLDGHTYYEHLHLDNHHDHLICVRCGAIVEFFNDDIESGQQRTCEAYGFTPLMHKLEIRGVCRNCAAAIPVTRSLAACLRGECLEVVEVIGGRGVRQRLHELGLVQGTVVKVVRADGPVSLEVRGGRIVLGRQEAAKVIVAKPGTTAPEG
ncbi:MAG: transcriptional repressor [Lentisphaeria bacterium]|nr:transcriptional repressor [Lentisphaeria bacterium]